MGFTPKALKLRLTELVLLSFMFASKLKFSRNCRIHNRASQFSLVPNFFREGSHRRQSLAPNPVVESHLSSTSSGRSLLSVTTNSITSVPSATAPRQFGALLPAFVLITLFCEYRAFRVNPRKAFSFHKQNRSFRSLIFRACKAPVCLSVSLSLCGVSKIYVYV